MYADYIYSAKGDTVRIRIFRRQANRWDADIATDHEIMTYCVEGACSFSTKRALKAHLETLYGSLSPMGNVANWAKS